MFYEQREFDIRCEWGRVGVSQLAPDSDAIVTDIVAIAILAVIAGADSWVWIETYAQARVRLAAAVFGIAQRYSLP